MLTMLMLAAAVGMTSFSSTRMIQVRAETSTVWVFMLVPKVSLLISSKMPT
jgi:hypothetical protein